MLCRIDGDSVQFISRNDQDWTHRFPKLVASARRLNVESAILDGEVVIYDKEGLTNFQLLQNQFSSGGSESAHYVAFDLLFAQGRSVMELPLLQRKELLKEIISKRGAPLIQFGDHVVGNGPEFFDRAKGLGAEGIISKRGNAPYRSGRGGDWLKIKATNRQEFVIGGFTPPAGSRTGFGALLVGYFDDEKNLRYAGRVGTGFNDRFLSEFHQTLLKREQDKTPFEGISRVDARGAHWVRPEFVCEIEFTNWTDEGILRHPSFQGLREDKKPHEVRREMPKARSPVKSTKLAAKKSKEPVKPRSRAGADKIDETVKSLVQLSSPDKVLYDEQGITKLDLARYYAQVGEHMLPHVLNRPLTLVRCPDGKDGECFYQKHFTVGAPKALGEVKIREKSKTGRYPLIKDMAGLLSLVQIGVLEIHVWGSRADDVERPDQLVFDLDPDPAVEWSEVMDAAKLMRKRLSKLNLVSFVKTTGGKGLHVVVPVRRNHEWPVIKEFCRGVVESCVADEPDRFVATMTKKARAGKIFIDFFRNDRGATAVAAYSTRAREGATVSTPLSWSELKPSLKPGAFTVETVPERLRRLKADPWADFFEVRQSISKAALAKVTAKRDRN